MSAYSDAKKLMKQEQKFSREKWNFELNTSSTAHQREVADLRAAGLNPVLSSGGSGASYSSTSDTSSTSSAAQFLSSSMSSKATKYAADRSLAAARVQAAATRAAAAAAAGAQSYAADRALEAAKYNTDNAKSGTVAGIVDKWVTRLGNDVFGKDFNIKDVYSNPGKYKLSQGTIDYLKNFYGFSSSIAKALSKSNMWTWKQLNKINAFVAYHKYKRH